MAKKIISDLCPQEIHRMELESSFNLMLKNRAYICSENGKLRPDMKQYAKAYEELLNKVGVLIGEVCLDDTLRVYYIRNDEDGKKCISDIKTLFRQYIPGMKTVVLKGTWKDFIMFESSFCDKASDIFIKYCIDSIAKGSAK